MPSPSDLLSDRRKLLLLVAGGLVAVALVAVVLALVSGDGGGEGETRTTTAHPLALTAPPDTGGIIGVDGQPAQIGQSDLDAIVAAVEGYLKEATVTPLSREKPEDGETTTTSPGTVSLAGYFTDAAGARLQTDDRLALSDEHLPFAKDGVTASRATLALSGIVQDGALQFVNAAVDAVLVVRTGDDDVTVKRFGDLVLRPVDGKWKIAAYKIDAERAFGDQTTTSQAAFG